MILYLQNKPGLEPELKKFDRNLFIGIIMEMELKHQNSGFRNWNSEFLKNLNPLKIVNRKNQRIQKMKFYSKDYTLVSPSLSFNDTKAN